MTIAGKKSVGALIVAALCAVIPTGSAGAGPIALGGSDTWNSWTTSDLLSGQFWANRSHDRNGLANIGYFMSRTPGSDVPTFYDASPGGVLPYLGDGSTTFALLLTEPWQPAEFTHLLSITGWDDEFGLFNVDTGEKYTLFSAWYTRGQSKEFFSTGTYGFYVANGDGQRGTARSSTAGATTSRCSRARTDGFSAWRMPPTRPAWRRTGITTT